MATAKELIDLAQSQIGTHEDPPGSNRVKYNHDYYGRDISGSAYPWCCAFQWWLFHTAGADNLFFGGEKTAHCDTLYHYYKTHGQAVAVSELQPGDLVFFNFDGNLRTMDHIGLCVGTEPGYVTTIDGNTSAGSQANGGAVLRRRRALRHVTGAARPAYDQPRRSDARLRVYHRVEDMPPYFQPSARKAIDLGIMGVDTDGMVVASYPSLQALTWMDRLGLLDRQAKEV